MPQARTQPRGRSGKKAVFSLSCGDEATTCHDRAFLSPPLERCWMIVSSAASLRQEAFLWIPPSVGGTVWKFVRLGLLFPALAYLAFQVRLAVYFPIIFSAKGCVMERKRTWKKYIGVFQKAVSQETVDALFLEALKGQPITCPQPLSLSAKHQITTRIFSILQG